MAFRSRKILTPEAALVRAEELCARAEHSSREIKDKFIKWGISPSAAEGLVDSLVDRRFIDDARFASTYAHDKMEYSRWGRRKIAMGLYQKGISRELISEALDTLDPESYERRLHETLRAKRRNMADADTYEGRTRLFRHAVSRGFEPDLVIKAIKALPSEE